MKNHAKKLMLAVGAFGVALGGFLLFLKLIPLLIALAVIVAAVLFILYRRSDGR